MGIGGDETHSKKGQEGESRKITVVLTYPLDRTRVRPYMSRLITSLLLALTILLGPAMCIGGIIEHSCECVGESSMECQHEDSCLDDPCASLVRGMNQEAQPNLELANSLALVVSIPLDVEPPPLKWSWSSRPPLPPNRRNLPFPQSDRPQRI